MRQPFQVRGWVFLAIAMIASLIYAVPARSHDGSVDDSMIQIRAVSDVQAKRDALVHFIWETSWSDVLTRQPTATQANYQPRPEDALPDTSAFSDFSNIEKIVMTMRVPGGAGVGQFVVHTSTAYLFHPHVTNGKVVIVHHGHGCALDGSDGHPYNLKETIQRLSDAQFAVVAMRMPLFQSPSECGFDPTSRSHNEMFTDPAQQPASGSGSPMQFFLEPVARVLNYIQQTYPFYHEFDMLGLSGGGWTTTLYAAIDPRITQSFPVAGSIPLYLRVDNPRGGGYPDDLEQYFAPFYAIAGYKDLYVLGSYGTNRRQTQILNRYDDCCFGEGQHFAGTPYVQAVNAYACDVKSVLAQLGSGTFVADIDESAHTHQIPLAALSGVILPNLQAPTAVAANCPTIASFSPPDGPVTGGTWVSISGQNLVHGGTDIFFDDLPALQWDGCPPIFFSDTCIRALSPSHAAGRASITAKVAGNFIPSPAGSFTYDPSAALTSIGYDPSRVADPPGWFTLNGFAPAGGAAVSFSSSDPAALPPPAPVTVPSGSWAGNFTLTFPPTPRAEKVTLTAHYAESSVSTQVAVRAWPVISLVLSVGELGPGQTATGTVTLNTPAPSGGATVALASSDPSAVPVPSSVVVPAGSFTTMFATTDNYAGTPKKVTVTASYNGATASAALTVPPIPEPPCKPRKCPKGSFWNDQDCQCEPEF